MKLEDYTVIAYDDMFEELLRKKAYPDSLINNIEAYEDMSKKYNLNYVDEDTERNGAVVTVYYRVDLGSYQDGEVAEVFGFDIKFNYRTERILSFEYVNEND